MYSLTVHVPDVAALGALQEQRRHATHELGVALAERLGRGRNDLLGPREVFLGAREPAGRVHAWPSRGIAGRAVGAERLGVAFVARERAIEVEQGRLPFQQLEDVLHTERLLGAQSPVDGPDELEVGRLVHRPSQVREILDVGDVGQPEPAGLLPDERRHVLALGGQPGLAPGRRQRGEGKHLGVLTVGEGRRLCVAHVVEQAATLAEAGQHAAGDHRIEQRAVGGDADDDRGAETGGGAVDAIEHIGLAPTVYRQAGLVGEGHDGVVGRSVGGGDDHGLHALDASGPLDQPGQHRPPRHVGQCLAGQPAGAHARLHDGGDHSPSLTGRPSTAERLAASAMASTVRPPAASSSGLAPPSMQSTR